eukprot:TRINITY_DN27079_c0_g2_i1.p1 TRINITY_DN27079_c0_g2~~TRINITY_DN27079_c0_g2_i1.p1  ORF type:complete len:254 (-),score=25.03 TRINITY_DN27079_c0_g2_i1:103-864(-)
MAGIIRIDAETLFQFASLICGIAIGAASGVAVQLEHSGRPAAAPGCNVNSLFNLQELPCSGSRDPEYAIFAIGLSGSSVIFAMAIITRFHEMSRTQSTSRFVPGFLASGLVGCGSSFALGLVSIEDYVTMSRCLMILSLTAFILAVVFHTFYIFCYCSRVLRIVCAGTLLLAFIFAEIWLLGVLIDSFSSTSSQPDHCSIHGCSRMLRPWAGWAAYASIGAHFFFIPSVAFEPSDSFHNNVAQCWDNTGVELT